MNGLRFFADHCISNAVVQALQGSGYQVFRLRDHLSPDSPDSVVISKAQELDAILLSLNGDFSDIVTYPPADYKGIIALQMRNHPEVLPRLLLRLTNFLLTHRDMSYYKGKLLIAEVHRIRTRGTTDDNL